MSKLYAQIADFTQIFNNYVYLNPAFVGTTDCPHVFTSYRSKDYSMGNYSSAYCSFDMGLQKQNSSVGASLLQDSQYKTFRETELLGIYAHSFQIKKNLFVDAALAMGYVYGTTDFSRFIFSDMLNVFADEVGVTGENIEKKTRHNFNSEMGVLLYNDIFYAGMTIKNLQGNISVTNKNLFPRIVSFHGMAKFSTTKAYMKRYLIWFYPHINMVIGGSSSYTQLGLILQKWAVQFGGAYRQNLDWNENSLSFFVGVVEKKFRFAYNCDMTRNSIKRIGTHEVSFGYQFDCREKKKKFEAVKAPTF